MSTVDANEAQRIFADELVDDSDERLHNVFGGTLAPSFTRQFQIFTLVFFDNRFVVVSVCVG